ncbi:radical SAM superfamily protein [Desulfovibrio sp. A2]|nr:radical SAM superfamily protein [Desulfovibrio sp. A2]
MKVLLAVLPPVAPDCPPLGAAVLAGALRGAGHECVIKDCNVELYAQCKTEKWRWSGAGWSSWGAVDSYAGWVSQVALHVCDAIAALSPDGVALSAASAGRAFASAVIDAVRARFPVLPILIGGAGFFYEEEVAAFPLREGVSICRGEGDVAICEWVSDVLRNKGLPSKVYEHRLIMLDDAPSPDYAGFPAGLYARRGVVPQETSRGCVNRCAFCDDAQMWGHYRMKSAWRVAQDVSACSGSARHVTFSDSVLNPTPQRMLQIVDALKTCDVTWDGMLQCKGIDKEIAAQLKASGCSDVFLGVESFNAEFLKVLGKTSVAGKARDAVECLSDVGVRVSMGLIVAGPPLQAREQFQSDLEAIARLGRRISCVAVNPLCIPQGSLLWARRAELGIVYPEVAPWRLWHTGRGNDDVQVRTEWCIEALKVLCSLGVSSSGGCEADLRHMECVLQGLERSGEMGA